MSRTPLTPDPLVDRFALAELPRLAPWVAEEIIAVGRTRVETELRRAGHDPEVPQLMRDWVSALSRCSSQFWDVA